MFYVSELINKRIVDPNGNRVARVRDLVAELVIEPEGLLPGSAVTTSQDSVPDPVEHDAPIIKGIVARTTRKHQPFYLPIDQVYVVGPHDITLRSLKVALHSFERRDGAILLTRVVWDKQLTALESRRFVRVNDILL